MQRLIFPGQGQEPVNRWAAQRRDFLLRWLLEELADIAEKCRAEEDWQLMAKMLPQWQSELPRLCTFLWPEPAQGLGPALQQLLWQLQRLSVTAAMASNKGQGLAEDAALERDNMMSQCKQQLDDLCGRCYELLPQEAGNPLLLRLLLEQPHLSVTLWKKRPDELFAELFPYGPAAPFLAAGKSYFQSHRLPEALAAFEQAVALDPDQDEARRRTFVIRGLLKARERRAT